MLNEDLNTRTVCRTNTEKSMPVFFVKRFKQMREQVICSFISGYIELNYTLCSVQPHSSPVRETGHRKFVMQCCVYSLIDALA